MARFENQLKPIFSIIPGDSTIEGTLKKLNDLESQLERGRGRVRFVFDFIRVRRMYLQSILKWIKTAILLMEPGAGIGITGEGRDFGTPNFSYHVEITISEITGNEADALLAWTINRVADIHDPIFSPLVSLGWAWEPGTVNNESKN